MDAIPRLDRRDHFTSSSVKAAQTPNRRVSRAVADSGHVGFNTLSVFQRTLLRISAWLQSRARAANIRQALLPFIRAAKQGSSKSITSNHFKKLQSALAIADQDKFHAAALFSEVVRENTKTLNLAELKRLHKLVRETATTVAQPENIFLSAVDHCVEAARAREANRNLSEALVEFSRISAEPFDVELAFNASAIQHNLMTIHDLVRPAGNYGADANAEHATSDAFESTFFANNTDVLKCWFASHSPAQKARVKLNLWSMAMDPILEKSEAESERLMYAFCEAVTKSLWPMDRRHAISYN